MVDKIIFLLFIDISPKKDVILESLSSFISTLLFEMKLKREYLSRHNRWVLSVWNKGRSDKNGKVKNYKTPDWTVFLNGEERELKPIQCDISSQADIQIGIIDLHGENDQV